MINLINQICSMDEKIMNNKRYIDLVSLMAENNIVDEEMLYKSICLGNSTIQLLIERGELTKKLWDEYGVLYLLEGV